LGRGPGGREARAGWTNGPGRVRVRGRKERGARVGQRCWANRKEEEGRKDRGGKSDFWKKMDKERIKEMGKRKEKVGSTNTSTQALIKYATA
jgi:hypothetical protein